jgi:uncharacterized protein YkwD
VQYYYYQTPAPAANTVQRETPKADQTIQPASVKESAPAPSASASSTASQTASSEGKETSDPYGFVSWLNSTRAAYGLGAVAHDPNLSSWAAVNNSYQAQRGIGHFVMGPSRRQNSAMGAYPGIEAMWMNSPAHRAALLDPTIRWIGIAGLGAYWTFNAN